MSLPRVRALLQGLLRLSAEDAEMPVEVLVNLHRTQLRAPLLRLAQLGTQRATGNSASEQRDAARAALVELCPILLDGKIFEADPDVVALSNAITSAASDTAWELGEEPLRQLTGSTILAQLVDESDYDWQPHEPLYNLHRITWPNAPVAQLAELLEAELILDSEIADAILSLAQA